MQDNENCAQPRRVGTQHDACMYNVSPTWQPLDGFVYLRVFSPALDLLTIGSCWSPDKPPVKASTPCDQGNVYRSTFSIMIVDCFLGSSVVIITSSSVGGSSFPRSCAHIVFRTERANSASISSRVMPERWLALVLATSIQNPRTFGLRHEEERPDTHGYEDHSEEEVCAVAEI